ncbi:MAG TPA: alpha/beta hydrolase [Lachnospiraceae bacterium]|nr:alpha/beta hydrolase [Lachnospiraceae bacterium]
MDEVTVSTTKTGYFFDGPGTESAIVFYPGGKVDTKAYAPLMYKLAEAGKDCFLVDMPLHMAFLDIGAADYYIDNYEYENWYLMGHSLGGAVLPAFLYKTDNHVDGIILLAAYSTFKIKRYVPVITIYGTNDGVMNTKRFNDCISNWSFKTQEVVIRGGNHSQFGYYGLQKGDNKASISREEQQEITVEAIIEWTDNLEKNKDEK